MSRRRAVEVVIARNGTLGPLHLAIPVGPGRWAAACRTPNGERRTLAGERVKTWTDRNGGDVWLEVRTCPDCAELGERARDTIELAHLAGWSR